jgi:peptidoglycan/LPS O-acetylase OafA/YrhL
MNLRFAPSITFGYRIRKTNGYTSGFDYLRLILSVLVLYGHSYVISGDHVNPGFFPPWASAIRAYLILPMFFSLSGFLVAASLLRTQSLVGFLFLRGLRIVPALFVEISLSALILGPVLTSLSLADYFGGKDFAYYFFNVIGYIHYVLPGVFLDNHISRTVNGSLWTVPYEAECYIALATLSLVGIVKRPNLLLYALIILTIGLFAFSFVLGDPEPTRTTPTGRQLVLFFLSGTLLYLARDHVPWSSWIAAVAALLTAILVASHVFIYLSLFPVAYITAFVGLLKPKKLPLLFTGDYSYGIYLYAYPIQQAVYQLVPASRHWYINFVVSFVVVGLFATFSWHCIEKPMLRLKRLVWTRPDQERPSPAEK